MRDWRHAAGLTQAEAAKLLSVDKISVSRWETGARRIKAEDFERARRMYVDYASRLNREVHGLSQSVPRGTIREAEASYQLSSDVASKLELFKRMMIRAGADDAEVDFIEETFRRPETARLAHHDSDGKDLSASQVEEQYDALIDGVRHIITRRIERRRKAPKAK